MEVFEQAPGEFGFGGVASLQPNHERVGGKQASQQMLAEFLVQFLRHLLPECSPMPHHAGESPGIRSAALGSSLINWCGGGGSFASAALSAISGGCFVIR